MRRKHIILLLAAGLLAGCAGSSGPTPAKRAGVEVECRVKTTPVKDQGTSSLCWAYAMLATIESEHLMRGDSVNLSPTFVSRRLLEAQARRLYFAGGRGPLRLRGMGMTLVDCLSRFGAAPYDSYPDPSRAQYGVLARKLRLTARHHACGGKGLSAFDDAVRQLLDDALGPGPAAHVYMLGAEYTPLEFAHSVCAPGEYLALASCTHHPFGTWFEMEAPDNWSRDRYLNLPLDSLVAHVDRALRAGHPVCWEGDMSNGEAAALFARVAGPVSQARRQRSLESLRTTDDHAVELTAIVSHGGQKYYQYKNSYGPGWGDGGFGYFSESFLRLYTVAVFMTRDAYSAYPSSRAR